MKLAEQNEMPAAALKDHGVMRAAVEFAFASDKAGVKQWNDAPRQTHLPPAHFGVRREPSLSPFSDDSPPIYPDAVE